MLYHITLLYTRLHMACLSHLDKVQINQPERAEPHARLSSDRGQATTEYALVLLAAALIALLAVGWATAGGGAGKIGQLFDRVIDSVIDRV